MLLAERLCSMLVHRVHSRGLPLVALSVDRIGLASRLVRNDSIVVEYGCNTTIHKDVCCGTAIRIGHRQVLVHLRFLLQPCCGRRSRMHSDAAELAF